MKLWKFLFILTLNSYSQTLLHNNVNQFIGVDVFENYYYLKENTLYKSNIENNYQNINYGAPDIVDISNPLQVLVYYKHFNKVVLLDNVLNYLSEFTIPIGIDLIANAGKDKIWMYNNLNTTLSLHHIKTNKTEVNSLPNIRNVKNLKADLNNAFILNNNGNLDTYNFLARKTKTQKTKEFLLPISLHATFYYKDKTIFKNHSPTITLPQKAESFEVINDHCYFFSNKTIYRMSISKK